jgi:hypothetical protein
LFIAMPQELLDAGASWSAVSSNPTRNCVSDNPPTEAACLWDPAPAVGDTITITAELSLPANVPPGTYVLTAQAIRPDDNGTLSQQLTVVTAPTPSPTPTASPTATPTASPAATPTAPAAPRSGGSSGAGPTAVPVPTAVPAGEGPAAGSPGFSPAIWLGLLALLGAGAVAGVRANGSKARHQA